MLGKRYTTEDKIRLIRDGLQTAQDHPFRPTDAQCVQSFGLVFVEHRGDAEINVGLRRAIAEAEVSNKLTTAKNYSADGL